ncbi:NUDIX domain-containing protein [Paenibacillus rhizovicinus]|uniref:NUDIX domain-containing protein n=1 Tax=Paenibacillus rhizovicinus TaxID=2704463 RepID=A0A6C0NWK2_9BACL|nr:NUDIX domain-containing protein [Paenibacillus rhizovicinus]QHW30548.1 NUDIX domain-containing protein [Paenibacillus rhizovicinus]
MKPIRNSAKAVIIDRDRVLLTKNEDQWGFFYLFPGGGQEKGEDLRSAVVRECLEEIGCEVEPGDIIHIREYIGNNHEFAEWDHDVHQVEFYFACRLVNHTETFHGSNPDELQVGVEWVALEQLHEVRLYPHSLIKQLNRTAAAVCYVGDTN